MTKVREGDFMINKKTTSKKITNKKNGNKETSREAAAYSKVSWKPGNMLYPVPAVMVSCARPGEKPNIITIAWVGTICSDPPMLSISVRKERYSYDILKETREFVVNLVTENLIQAADTCGVKSGRDTDKYKELKLTPLPSNNIQAPGIAESPVNLECVVTEIKKLGSHDLFLAKIVGVTVDEKYLDSKGKFNLNSTGLVAYSHGEYYELGRKLGTFGYSVKKGGLPRKRQSGDGRKQNEAGKKQGETGRKQSEPGRKPVESGRKQTEPGRKQTESGRKQPAAADQHDKKPSAGGRRYGK